MEMSAELESLFSSAARVHVLRLFLLNPDREFYQREIERETGQPIRAVQREVKRLTEIGLLNHTTEKNRVFYCLNTAFPLLAELTALFEKATGTARVEARPTLPPKPWAVRQPFEWLETLPVPPLPLALRRLQVEGEWDRAY